LYRWNGSSWQSARDAGITQALSDAAAAQSTADGKIESFYQSTMPSGSLGDFWIDTDDGNKLYRHNGTTFIEVQDDAIATAISDAAGAQATADGKVTTFYQTSAPTAEGVGDLWYDTDAGLLYRWDGSNWTNQLATWSTPAIADNAITDVTVVDVATTTYDAADDPVVAGSYTISKPANTTFIRVTAVGTLQVYDVVSGPKDINVDYSLRADGVVYRNTSFNVTVPTGYPLRRRNNFSLVYVFDEADLANGDVVDLYISDLNGTGTPEAFFEETQIIVEYIKR
jgi:hypothetical protein